MDGSSFDDLTKLVLENNREFSRPKSVDEQLRKKLADARSKEEEKKNRTLVLANEKVKVFDIINDSRDGEDKYSAKMEDRINEFYDTIVDKEATAKEEEDVAKQNAVDLEYEIKVNEIAQKLKLPF